MGNPNPNPDPNPHPNPNPNPIRHCAVISPGSTWVALWNAIGELDGALNAGMLSQNKRCLCEDTSKEYALDDAPEYDLYSLRGEC